MYRRLIFMSVTVTPQRQRSKRHIVGVVGPTGAGKTTLAEGLARHYNFKLHREEPQDNPYWSQFYAELQTGGVSPVALKSQLFFLLTAQKQADSIRHTKKQSFVWDVPLFGHKMYADLLHAQGVMTDADYEIYCSVYSLCLNSIPKPDVLVVATTNLQTLQARIAQRGRQAELATPAEYWHDQIKYWDEKLSQPSQIPLLKVDSGEINWTTPTGVSQVWELTTQVLRS